MSGLTILVGTVGQSVMRSTDDGRNWERVGPRRGFPYEALVRCLAVHPRQPNVIFAGTERGLYRSDDRGQRWRLIDSPLTSHHLWALAIDPVEPEIMFAGSGTPTPATIFRSIDGGKSWQPLAVEIAKECENVGTPRVTAIAIDPEERRNVWVGLEVDGARVSTDRGETWSDVAALRGKDVHNIAVSGGGAKSVLIVVNREIYRSRDGGASWEAMRAQERIPWGYPRSQTYLRAIALHPSHEGALLLGIGDATPGTAGAIARSRDLAESWELLPLPTRPNSTIWAFGTHPADPRVVFAGSRYGYLYRSDDGGQSWTKLAREFSEIAAVRWVPND